MLYIMKRTTSVAVIFTLLCMLVDSKEEENVALRGRATMSSTYIPDGPLSAAINAIDGNQDSTFSHASCVTTDIEDYPWWRVDLLESHTISRITITHRKGCCSSFSGAEILIGDSLANNGNNNARCAKITSTSGGATETFHCNGMQGRYVNVALPGKNGVVTFCEIQIFGVPVNNKFCWDRSF
ncbi:fucolectin-like [Hyperolius riggenbachi]|uniref:fucolectin-like n=1 Tax=Hyperolius riggenbachi TaxID=752182 RepID=UPI0035A2B7FE